jgi:hypothetical protein
MATSMGIDPATNKYVPFNIINKTYAINYHKHMLKPIEDAGLDFWWLDWQQGEVRRDGCHCCSPSPPFLASLRPLPLFIPRTPPSLHAARMRTRTFLFTTTIILPVFLSFSLSLSPLPITLTVDMVLSTAFLTGLVLKPSWLLAA